MRAENKNIDDNDSAIPAVEMYVVYVDAEHTDRAFAAVVVVVVAVVVVVVGVGTMGYLPVVDEDVVKVFANAAVDEVDIEMMLCTVEMIVEYVDEDCSIALRSISVPNRFPDHSIVDDGFDPISRDRYYLVDSLAEVWRWADSGTVADFS